MKNKENKFLKLDDTDFYWNSIMMFNEFNKDSSFGVFANIIKAYKDNDKDINLFINSYGGVVDDLLVMIDAMNLVKNDIATIGLGCCASCGAVLLASGTKGKRFMTENARVMIHQVSAWAIGKNSDIQIRAKEVDRINKQIASILAKATGKSKKQILEDFKEDKWFTAKEALEYGLIDKIITPKDIKSPELEKKDLNKNTDSNFVFNYELKSFEEDDEYYRLKGIASTPEKDLCYDIVKQEALIDSVEKYGLPSFLHLHNQLEAPLGNIDEVYLENGKTVIEAKMPKGVKDNDEIAILIKDGAYKGLSIGYSVLKYHHENDIRVITEIMWHETSLVSVPCNPNAKLQEFKNKDLKKKSENVKFIKNIKSLKELEEVLKSYGLTNREILACIYKIKELALNKDTAPTSDLSENPLPVSDLQALNEKAKILQNTINNIIGK